MELSSLTNANTSNLAGNTSNLAQEASKDLVAKPKRLKCFEFFPLPMFLLKQNMEIIETNKKAELAVTKNHVGLADQKMHFNCRDNDNYVKEIILRLRRNHDSSPSERFILRSLDLQYTVFTIALESDDMDSNLILTMHEVESSDGIMMKSLIRAFNLTRSESNIISMMVKGLKPKEIAYELGLSLNTVRSHLRTLYAKMQVRGYNDALTRAIKLIG